MKLITLSIFVLSISLNSFALDQATKDHLVRLDQNRTGLHTVSYLIDLSLPEFLNKTLTQVWGDERLSGHCFGVKAKEFGTQARELRGAIAFDRYPVSWRDMSRTFSDLIYRESRNYLGLSIQEASVASGRFRKDVEGKYFKGCKLEWLGSFGGGSSTLYISEDGKTTIGRISSWSE
jgi:hypothetical protein